MIRIALNYSGRPFRKNAIMVGDWMDTDIVTGVASGIETILVLSGVTRREDVRRFPYEPTRIVLHLSPKSSHEKPSSSATEGANLNPVSVQIKPEVADALQAKLPVVALESTLITHGSALSR